MLASHFLGEDTCLEDGTAGIASGKGYTFSRCRDKRDFFGTILHSPPYLIIIAPSRKNEWHVVKIAAAVRVPLARKTDKEQHEA